MPIKSLIDVSSLPMYASMIESGEKFKDDVTLLKVEAVKYGKIFEAVSRHLKERHGTHSPVEKAAVCSLIDSEADALGIPRKKVYKTLGSLLNSEDPASYMIGLNPISYVIGIDRASIRILDEYAKRLVQIAKIESKDVEKIIDACQKVDLLARKP